jgi:ribonuclease HI
MSSDLTGYSGVFYVDGSCRPHNPGYIGWGIHGYYYKDTVEEAVIAEGFEHTDMGYVNVNIDINQRPKNAKFVVPTHYVDGFGSQDRLASNNVAEIMGFYNLLKHIQSLGLVQVRVYTDSQYLRDCINDWCEKWVKRNWTKPDGSPVSNHEILEKTHSLLQQINTAGTTTHLAWIRAHNGHLGNERADVLAGIGMNHSQKLDIAESIETSEYKGYWKFDADTNPYVAFRRLYFNSLEQYNQPGVYHLAESADTDFILGKPSASTGYSVVYLKEPDPIVEVVKKKQFEWSKGLNVICLAKLDAIYSKYVYPWIKKHGEYVMIGQKHSHSLELVNRKSVTVEMNPTGLSMNALNHFAVLEETLLAFKRNEVGNEHPDFLHGCYQINVHDITDRFFASVEGKKGAVKYELRPEFIVGFRNMSIHVDVPHKNGKIPVQIPYALGYDCLPRNNLKHLEQANPKIYLLTWADALVLRYCTVITSDYGLGIWSNYFANQVLLPG